MYDSYVFCAKHTQACSVRIFVFFTCMKLKRVIRSGGSQKKEEHGKSALTDLLRFRISTVAFLMTFPRIRDRWADLLQGPRSKLIVNHDRARMRADNGHAYTCIYTTKDCARPWVSLSTHPGEPSSLHPHARSSLSRASSPVDAELYRRSQDLVVYVCYRRSVQ